MGKKSQKYSKIYREFTRVKFAKYKLQYPRLRQSQVVAKIIKEWEAMDQNAKQNLQKQYIERSGRGFLEDPSSSDKKSKQKTGQKKGSSRDKAPRLSSSAQDSQKKTKKITKKKKPSPKTRVFSDPTKKISPDKNQNSKSPGKKSTPSKNQGSSSDLIIQKAKGSKGESLSEKLIISRKKRKQQYASFYKYYYQRLSAEHPRWSHGQIKTIIKLLWRKRLVRSRKQRKIITKGLTGRQLFNRTKQSQGLLRDQIKKLWKALPHQSKKYWQIKGQGKPRRAPRDSGKIVKKMLNSGATKQSQPQNKSSFGWMNSSIH